MVNMRSFLLFLLKKFVCVSVTLEYVSLLFTVKCRKCFVFQLVNSSVRCYAGCLILLP